MPTPNEVREILRKVRQIDIRTNRLVTEALGGQYHSVFKGRGMDFDEVREYVPGDEVRRIDWNVTARTGHPFVKKFTEERELTILLLVDLSASGDFGSGSGPDAQSKRELAAEVASVLAFSAIRNHDKVGLILFTDQIEAYIPPQKGRRHVLRVVREILFFEPQRRGTDLGHALDFANRVTPRRAVAFLLSDFRQEKGLEGMRRGLRMTARRHDLVAVPIEDRRERELPDVGLLMVENAETGELVEVDTGSRAVRDRFARHAEARAAALRETLRGEAVDSLELRTGEPYVPALMHFFRNRKKRR